MDEPGRNETRPYSLRVALDQVILGPRRVTCRETFHCEEGGPGTIGTQERK